MSEEIKVQETTSSAPDPFVTTVDQPPVPESIKPAPTSLNEEALKLQTAIREGMPTRDEMIKGEPRTVRKNIDWERRVSSDIKRYLEIRKELPKLSSVEKLRK